MTNQKGNSEKEYWIWIIGLLFVILILGLWYYNYSNLKDLSPEKRGTFGDMFGSVNAIFSGLAFAGIIITILLQRQELKYQRRELSATRKEFSIQNRTLRLQRFEHTFFNLLNLHHQIVSSMDRDVEKQKRSRESMVAGAIQNLMDAKREYERVIITGRDVFALTYKDLVTILNGIPNDDIQDINSKYLENYETVQTDFGHYFRNLYRIIKLVDETEFISHSELDVDSGSRKRIDRLRYTQPNYLTKYKYTSIVRSQLSDYELLWLFYNCLSPNGNEKFKPLIEKYSLLKNIPLNKLHNSSLSEKYSKNAFNNN